MFCRFVGNEEKTGPRKGYVYYLTFLNFGIDFNGMLKVSMPIYGRENLPVYNNTYNSFDDMLKEWEIV